MKSRSFHSATRAKRRLIRPLQAFTGNRIVSCSHYPGALGMRSLFSAAACRGRHGLFRPFGAASIAPATSLSLYPCTPPARRRIICLAAFQNKTRACFKGTGCGYPRSFPPMPTDPPSSRRMSSPLRTAGDRLCTEFQSGWDGFISFYPYVQLSRRRPGLFPCR